MIRFTIVPSLLLLVGSSVAAAPFQNLNFEDAMVPPDAEYFGSSFSATEMIPGWSTNSADVHYGTGRPMLLEDPPPVVTLWDAEQLPIDDGSPHVPRIAEGKYSLNLATFGTWISQTGDVPTDAESLTLLERGFDTGVGLFNVSVNGEVLQPFVSNLVDDLFLFRYDVSAFAGETSTLRIEGHGVIDDIQFSPIPVPEPSTAMLAGLGFVILVTATRKACTAA